MVDGFTWTAHIHCRKSHTKVSQSPHAPIWGPNLKAHHHMAPRQTGWKIMVTSLIDFPSKNQN
ncbi:hypothetical protein Pyn_20051 [Prunus yedoensis var. nudiflora]|uniref:Uncharacterized protein n=1 Tax=Prunus yedoensis var. nudiflora TaxID=2094558 RepID=A0A314YZT0_PRUYE|nr:hypothetical protein Pyn_20051 [Prunus yedoensis var. nudiflora]